MCKKQNQQKLSLITFCDILFEPEYWQRDDF